MRVHSPWWQSGLAAVRAAIPYTSLRWARMEMRSCPGSLAVSSPAGLAHHPIRLHLPLSAVPRILLSGWHHATVHVPLEMTNISNPKRKKCCSERPCDPPQACECYLVNGLIGFLLPSRGRCLPFHPSLTSTDRCFSVSSPTLLHLLSFSLRLMLSQAAGH